MADPTPTRRPPGFAPRESRTVLAATVGQAVVVVGGLLPVPALVLAVVEVGATLAFAGLVVGVFGLGQAFMQLPLGLLSDRLGRRRVVGMALGLLVAGSVVGALWATPTGLFAARLLAGLSALTAVSLAWVHEVVPGRRGERGLAVVAVGGGLAAILAIPVGVLAALAFDVAWSLLAIGVPALVIALAASVVRTEPPPVPGRRAALAPAVAVRLLALPALRRLLGGAVLLDAALVAWLVAAVALAGPGLVEASGWVRILVGVGMALAGVLGLGAAARRVDAGRWAQARWLSAGLLCAPGLLVAFTGVTDAPLAGILWMVGAAIALFGMGAATSTFAAAVVVMAPESARPEATALRVAAGGIGLLFGGLLGGMVLGLGGALGAGILVAVLAALGGLVARFDVR